MTVWIAFAGEYSGRFTVGVFSNKEAAELASITGEYNGYMNRPDVEEWEIEDTATVIDQEYTDRIMATWTKNGLGNYWVFLRGDETTVERVSGEYRKEEDISPAVEGVRPEIYEGAVWARDEEHAAKIASERRARKLAEGR